MKSEKNIVEFDVIFEKLKPYGRYNLLIFITMQWSWFGMACDSISGFTSLGGLKPEYKCADQNMLNTTDKCSLIRNCSTGNLTVVSQFYSIYQEFEWACIDMQIPWTFASLSWLTNIPVYFVGGHLADRFGRKWMIFTGLVICQITSLLSAISPTWQFYLGMDLIGSVRWPLIFGPLYPLTMETIGKKQRLLQSFAGQWILAYPIAGLAAYLTGDWRSLAFTGVIIAAPMMISFLFLVQESPRWLIQKRRYEQAAVVLNRIAWVNGQTERFMSDELTLIDVAEDPKAHIYDVFKIFCNPTLLKYTISLVVVASSFSFVFSVIFMNIQDLAGSPFLNVALLGILRCWSPVAIIIERKVLWFGRRMQLLGTMSTATSCFVFIVVVYAIGYRDKLHVLTSAAGLFGYAITVSLGGVAKDQLETELFPTIIRTTATGVIDVMRVALASLGPQFVYMRNYWNGLPYLGAACILTVGIILSFIFIPETKNRTLPDNFHKNVEEETKKELLETSV